MALKETVVVVLVLLGISSEAAYSNGRSLIVNTWPWPQATAAAWESLVKGGSRLDALVAGCSVAEEDLSITSVGYGGSPDEYGETTLDAMIMDGVTHDVGSVGCLRNMKHAIAVARAVMDYTTHTLLVGNLATEFALSMGFAKEGVYSEESVKLYEHWRNNSCQPNYRKSVQPDPTKSCGPYNKEEDTYLRYLNRRTELRYNPDVDETNHDTIGMIVIDKNGDLAGGTSTNGATHKVPGRVGDSPIAGAGAYVDNDVGGCAATGDGDVMMRFLPCFHAVELMRSGMSPSAAAAASLKKIATKYPDYSGALVVANKNMSYGAACTGFESFHYCVRTDTMKDVEIASVDCFK